MRTKELKSDQLGAGRRSVSYPVSSLIVTKILAPLSEKKKKNQTKPNKPQASFSNFSSIN